jgi:hypothetical protein
MHMLPLIAFRLSIIYLYWGITQKNRGLGELRHKKEGVASS